MDVADEEDEDEKVWVCKRIYLPLLVIRILIPFSIVRLEIFVLDKFF